MPKDNFDNDSLFNKGAGSKKPLKGLQNQALPHKIGGGASVVDSAKLSVDITKNLPDFLGVPKFKSGELES